MEPVFTEAFHSDCIIRWCTHRGQRAIICPVCRDQQPLQQTPRAQPEAAPQVIGSVEGALLAMETCGSGRRPFDGDRIARGATAEHLGVTFLLSHTGP